jgi:GTP-binding protein YchF
MLRAALVGYPAVGKTTLFELMTSVDAAHRAGKGDVNVGVSRVPDPRLDRLTALYNPRKRTPATVEFADLAAGRSDAKALLDVAPYRNADALVHVVRAFRDEATPHVHATIDPARDARTMEQELALADLGVVERRLERLDRDLRKSRTADLERERDLLVVCRAALEDGRPIRAVDLDADGQKRLRGFQFLSAKPLLLLLNLDETDLPHAAGAVAAAGLTGLASAAGVRAITVCAKIELEIAQLDPADAAAFLRDLGLAEPGVDRVIRASYDLLGYHSFFTVGDDECRAWSIPRGATALSAAGEIHTDISRGFIRAEVVAYEALAARGSFQACRDHAEVRLEGKDYVMRDGDVVNFRFAT